MGKKQLTAETAASFGTALPPCVQQPQGLRLNHYYVQREGKNSGHEGQIGGRVPPNTRLHV